MEWTGAGILVVSDYLSTAFTAALQFQLKAIHPVGTVLFNA
jgi:hypothetical protein